MSDSPLADLAVAALDAVIAFWPGPPALPLPARRYVNVGTPPSDCEQLTVSWERTFGTASSPALERIIPISDGTPWLRTAVFAIQIIRCVPVITEIANAPVFPAPDALSEVYSAILDDSDFVLLALIAAQNAGELAGCGGIAMQNATAVTAQGGLAGSITRVRLNVGF